MKCCCGILVGTNCQTFFTTLCIRYTVVGNFYQFTSNLVLVAKLQLDQDGVKTGITLQPYSQCLVMNSHPGNLQFYNIEQNRLWLEV